MGATAYISNIDDDNGSSGRDDAWDGDCNAVYYHDADSNVVNATSGDDGGRRWCPAMNAAAVSSTMLVDDGCVKNVALFEMTVATTMATTRGDVATV